MESREIAAWARAVEEIETARADALRDAQR